MNEIIMRNCSKQQELDIYCNFENSQWGSKIFRGVIKDYNEEVLILTSDKREFIIPIRFINWIEVRKNEQV